MKVSYQWLSEYVDLSNETPETLAERLTSGGLAVDAVERRNRGVSGVVVGLVVDMEGHPDADRLHVCQVDVGGEERLQIVCGATNVAPGVKVPVALPGASLPGDMKIKQAKLRGVTSNGMLCSASELGLDTRLLPAAQTTGLYILPEEVAIGADIVTLLQLDDTILDVDLTPNRSDCLSIRGLAYEIAAVTKTSTRFPAQIDLDVPNTPSPIRVTLATDGCPQYEAQVLRGVDARPSPLWMQMRLMAMGVRSIDVVVDVTNYVMLEWGQPLHAFDAEAIADSHIVVRQAVAGETLVTLDGQTRQLDEEMIVIADTQQAIGLAGVMGGENSEMTRQTKNVVIESARFDARTTRRTGQKLGLHSEAQQRFEKGVDPLAVRNAILRATQLLTLLADATPVGGVVTAHHGDAAAHEPRQISFSPMLCRQLLGVDISDTQMADIFAHLGFLLMRQEDAWTVSVPSRRPDISMQADLVEEVARLYGYDNIPSTSLIGSVTPGVRDRRQAMVEQVRDELVNHGLFEVRTYAFTSPQAMSPLAPENSQDVNHPIPLAYPMSDERSVLRTHMLPSLAEVARHNLSHRTLGGAIFELGRAYVAEELPLNRQPQEREHFAMLWFGETADTLYQQARRYDFYDAKGAVEGVLAKMGIAATYTPAKVPWLHPGRSASVNVGDVCIGVIGEIHPNTAQRLDVGRAVYAELDVAKLLDHRQMALTVESLPRFPGSRRDLALVVDEAVAVGDLLSAIRQVDEVQDILRDVRVFDVYVGESVGRGKKSVAIGLLFQAAERTLIDIEIDEAVQSVLNHVGERWDAQLRG